MVRVNLLIADAAQVADGKLYILGGGLTAVGPRPQPMGVAIRIEVPWDRANVSHEWRIELLDEDGHPLMIGERPLVVQGNFEAGRPVGLRPGTPRLCPLGDQLPDDSSDPRQELHLATLHQRPPLTQTGVKASLFASPSKPALPIHHPGPANRNTRGPPGPFVQGLGERRGDCRAGGRVGSNQVTTGVQCHQRRV